MSTGLKINADKLGTAKAKRFSKSFKITAMVIFFIVVVIGVNIYSSIGLRDTVEIIKLSSSVPQDGQVLQSGMYKDTMLRSEYEKQGVFTLSDGTKRRSIVLWEDKGKIVNAYASYYIRQDTPLYWDALTKETPKQYSYLYQMDGELLKIDMDAGEFGKMLVPGDRINVRASYTETDYTLPTEREFQIQQQTGIQPQTSIKRNILLFNNVVVLDILNSKGESIFDLYYKLLALPKSQQRAMVQTDEFQKQVVPSQILLNVTPEEADRYMEIVGNGPKYLMTLLPRSSGNLITEALNDLQIGFARQ